MRNGRSGHPPGSRTRAYDDTMYVTELVAPDTVNTMPEATLNAVADHGSITGATANSGYDEARGVFAAAGRARHRAGRGDRAARGRGRAEVHGLLVVLLEGVQKQLDRRARRRPASERRLSDAAGDLAATSGGGLTSSSATPTRPATPPRSISWWPIGSPAGSPRRTRPCGGRTPSPSRPSGCPGRRWPRRPGRWSARSPRCATSCSTEGMNHMVLAGMGGSSLAPEVISATAGVELVTLDTTDAGQVAAALADGWTTPCWWSPASPAARWRPTRTAEPMRRPSPTTVSTPSSGSWWSPIRVRRCSRLAEDAGYRKVFLADPDVGGRYSALTAFGLVPAGLAGADIGALLDDAAAAGTGAGRRRAEQPRAAARGAAGPGPQRRLGQGRVRRLRFRHQPASATGPSN